MGVPAASEARRAPRFRCRVMVEYECVKDFLVDYCANMSVGGMFIQTDHPLEPGTRFRLRFKIPDHEELIETTGEVRWAVGADAAGKMTPGMGIRFEDLDDTAAAAVDQWLTSWGAEEYP